MALLSVVDSSGALLAGARRLAFQFVERLAVPAFVVDERGRVLVWNEACARLTGMHASNVVGTRDHWRAFFDEHRPCLVDLVIGGTQDRVGAFYTIWQRTDEGGLFAENWCSMPERGEPRYLAIDASPIVDNRGNLIAAIETLRDITERKRAEAEIEHLATHDAVTGLANRLSFARKLEELDSASAPYAILLFDIDRFQGINETLGQPAGDAVLSECALLARSLCPRSCVARLGCDEFAIVLEGSTARADAQAVAGQLLAVAGRGLEYDGTFLTASFSIGIAAVPLDAGGAADAIRRATHALNGSKASGGAAIRFFEPSLAAQSSLRQTTMTELRKAIARDEFVLHYQPVVSPDGEPAGFEALLRWRHSRRGMVAPAEFIPLAEQSGLIGPIGEWVLRQACREAVGWSKPLGIAVNLSPIQFRVGDIVETVRAVLQDTGLQPSRLTLELTETAMMDNPARTLAVLDRLKVLGVRIAMDDFGTGYSSLAYLQAFEFDAIKLDRSFVARLGESEQADAITRAIIALAHTLSMRIIAEGVETQDQRRFLSAEGCDLLQGYLFGRPAPAEVYRALTGAGGVPAPEELSRAG